MKLIFVRHPETQANVDRIIYGRTQSEYSERGKKSIPWVVDYLKNTKIDYIYASPLNRTKLLAEAIVTQHDNTEIVFEDRLMEMSFGVFENMSNLEAQSKYPSEYESFMASYSQYKIPEGEAFFEVKDRAVEFIK